MACHLAPRTLEGTRTTTTSYPRPLRSQRLGSTSSCWTVQGLVEDSPCLGVCWSLASFSFCPLLSLQIRVPGSWPCPCLASLPSLPPMAPSTSSLRSSFQQGSAVLGWEPLQWQPG